MKKFFYLSLLLCLCSSISAQKNVDIDSHRFRLSYRELPSSPLDPKFFYYSKSISLPADTRHAVNDMENLNNSLKIEGQRYVTDINDADFSIELKIDPVSFRSPEMKERVEETKDKAGKVTSRKYYYWVELTYSVGSSLTLKQKDKTLKTFYPQSSINTRTHRSNEYSTSNDASNNWKLQSDDLANSIRKDLAYEAAAKASTTLSEYYGFPKMTSGEMIKTIDEKKHPENTPLREMADRLRSKLEGMSADSVLTEADVAEELAYFKELPNRYTDPKLKADKKLRYVGYYNVAKIYYYLDQPEKVAEYADLLFVNDHDKNDGKKMKEAAEKLIEKFNNSEIKTRHFTTDPYFKD